MDWKFSALAGLEEKIPAPAYVFEETALEEELEQIRSLLPACHALCFAMKANPFLVSLLESRVDRFEVCSPGEYEICHERGVDPGKIIVSGVNKTPASMDRILSLSGGRGIYTIESPMHLEILEQAAARKDLNLNVMIRLSSGNQFGVDRECFLNLLNRVLNSSHLRFQGIHYFSGTQKKLKKIEKELTMLEELGLELRQTFGLASLELEYGPGLAVGYFEDDKMAPAREQLTRLNEMLEGLRAFDAVGIELGRFMASSCGFFLTKVVDLKTTQGCSYVILDSGIHQLHYFGQMMGMKLPAIRQVPERSGEQTYVLCGSLCTVNDVMVRDAVLHPLQVGDTLIFGGCGAYSMTESSALFLSRELPGVYVHGKNGSCSCLRQVTETYPFNTFCNEERNL